MELKKEFLCWSTLRMMRRIQKDFIPYESIISDPIDRAVIGYAKRSPDQASNIGEQVILTWSWWKSGESVDPDWCRSLEERAKQNDSYWPLAARIHALSSSQRENQARANVSIQQIPFSLPKNLSSLQVEMFAAGDRVLHVIHVDWLRKLTEHLVDALVLDCRYIGLWFDPILDILPEKIMVSALKKIPKARRLRPGSLGLAAYYAWRLGMKTEIFLKNATPKDIFLFEISKRGDQTVEIER
ncbi:MAG: hypothetical protein VX278_11155 [Myxococcota bacterium]|nr:hypothetical protein [Myxococcota bacterium]